MIKLLKYLASNLQEKDLYNLAIFMSSNPDIIDQETLLHIIHEVDQLERQGIKVDHSMYKKMEEHFNEQDINSEIYKLLKDNNIGLN
jgi:hypothetical protein